MSHIRVLICRVDDPATDHLTELAAFDLPTPDVAALESTTTLDDLESVTQQTGNAILRRVLQAQWELIDAALVAQHRQRGVPQPVAADGHEPVTVASRFGILTLSRQVCQHGPAQPHVLPGNAVLPPHHGIIITRGLHLLGLLTAAGTPLCVRSAAAWMADPRGADPGGDNCAQPRALPRADHSSG